MKETRIRKISEEIRRALSDILRNKLRDPRVGELVSISQVRVSGDLSQAHVGISVFGSAEEREETIKALERAKGFLRTELGRSVKLRTVPELIFDSDTTIEDSMHMYELIREVNHEEQ